ncbi:hypothetical protein E3W66_04930 [Gammaproteobacteria bacterium LSUCC0057]|uniref:Aminoglycoside phosphotransferase domain-containing protein n=1 Tax=Gammaproteobacteria bacterium LSUCC0057 TaxID=2559237 RepID=A0A4Y8UNK5_9GAMM|nr:hypothetical protein E3W66_04930 [Gammaproteobacteria bacterium LSUCC0057]
MTAIALQEALDSWSQWQLPPPQRPSVLAELPGGRVNQSFLLAAGPWRGVLRLNNPRSAQLGIDRRSEAALYQLLAGKPYLATLYHASERFLVSEYIVGRQWQQRDCDDPRQRQRLRALIDDYTAIDERAAPPSLRRYQYSAYCNDYLQQLPVSQCHTWQPLLQRAMDLDCYLDSRGRTLVHHDLSAANVIDSPRGLVILDWEYAGLSTAAFDLQWLAEESVDKALEPMVRELSAGLNQLWQLLAQR